MTSELQAAANQIANENENASRCHIEADAVRVFDDAALAELLATALQRVVHGPVPEDIEYCEDNKKVSMWIAAQALKKLEAQGFKLMCRGVDGPSLDQILGALSAGS